jgi:hypothetical protein
MSRPPPNAPAPRRGRTGGRALLPALLALAVCVFGPSPGPRPAVAQPPLPGSVPLSDVLELVILDRELIAVDARGGGESTLSLLRAEQVLFSESRGEVGVVITNERLLAVSVNSGSWQETGWQRSETVPSHALLGGRVALAVTEKRAIGFDGRSGNLVESSFGPRERLVAQRVDENVALVVTDRRALGLSPWAGGFFATRLDLGDQIQEISVRANLATITTEHRLLMFRAPSGVWAERRLGLQ